MGPLRAPSACSGCSCFLSSSNVMLQAFQGIAPAVGVCNRHPGHAFRFALHQCTALPIPLSHFAAAGGWQLLLLLLKHLGAPHAQFMLLILATGQVHSSIPTAGACGVACWAVPLHPCTASSTLHVGTRSDLQCATCELFGLGKGTEWVRMIPKGWPCHSALPLCLQCLCWSSVVARWAAYLGRMCCTACLVHVLGLTA